MKWRVAALFPLILILFLPLAPKTSQGEWVGQSRCLVCHGKREYRFYKKGGYAKNLYVSLEELRASVHKEKFCSDCHTDVVELPHRGTPSRVSCTTCHYKGNPEGAPQLDAYLEYERSIHGLEAKEGNPDAPLCQDCHGSHNVRPPEDPLSTVNKRNVARTCGKCHIDIYAEFRTSIHGVAVARGVEDAPSCPDCHGEHNILEPTNPESTVYPSHVPTQCSKCHAREAIREKYGIKAEPVKTYRESFHGVAIEFGARTVANCASCHGTHDIRPPEDPLSSVNPENIPKTCGKCHPGATPKFAEGKIHIDPTKKEAGAVYYVASFFKYLTITTMLGLICHILLDLYGRVRRMRRKERMR